MKKHALHPRFLYLLKEMNGKKKKIEKSSQIKYQRMRDFRRTK